ASWNTSSQANPMSIRLQNRTTNQTLDGPVLTLTGVRLTGLMVKSFFLRTLDLGMVTFADSLRHTVRRCSHEPNVGARRPRISERAANGEARPPAIWAWVQRLAVRRAGDLPAG